MAKCKTCGHKTSVIYTYGAASVEDVIVARTRVCHECGTRLTTYEIAADRYRGLVELEGILTAFWRVWNKMVGLTTMTVVEQVER